MSENTETTPSGPTADILPADPLEPLIQALRAFASARDWEQFHTPKNLREMADQLKKEGVEVKYAEDLAAAQRKLVVNGEKYPVDKSRGNAKKYSEL